MLIRLLYLLMIRLFGWMALLARSDTLFFVMEIQTRRVYILGVTAHPPGA